MVTYGDENWGDLLTAYDGKTITYDANGNPLSYYNGELALNGERSNDGTGLSGANNSDSKAKSIATRENGRRLATVAVGNSTVSYTYDYSGTRATKTVNGVLHNYYYCDNISSRGPRLKLALNGERSNDGAGLIGANSSDSKAKSIATTLGVTTV